VAAEAEEDSTAEDLAVEGSTEEASVAGISVVMVEAFTLVVLLWEDCTAAAWALLEESAIPLARGRHTGSQST
jgi:hypothetical protein